MRLWSCRERTRGGPRWTVGAALAVAGLAMGIAAVPVGTASAQTAGCDALFPGQVWSGTATAGPVAVVGADLSLAEIDRFASEILVPVDLIMSDLGHLEGVAVCLFGATVPLDPAPYVPRGQRVQALALTEERLLVIEALDARMVQRAAGFGLTYLALAGLDPAPYPQPLGYAVGQWYVSRVEGTVEQNHAIMSRASFLTQPSATGWTADAQSPTFAWNPQFQESPIGDIVDFAVSTRGLDVIRRPGSFDWVEIETEWVAAIDRELLGRSTPTTGWIFGIAFFLGMISLAVFMAVVSWRNKRVRQGRRGAGTPTIG